MYILTHDGRKFADENSDFRVNLELYTVEVPVLKWILIVIAVVVVYKWINK